MLKKIRLMDLKLVFGMIGMYLLIQIGLLAILLFTTELSDAPLWVRTLTMLATFMVSVSGVWFLVRKKVSYFEVVMNGIMGLSAFVLVGDIISNGIELRNIITMVLLIVYALYYIEHLSREGEAKRDN